MYSKWQKSGLQGKTRGEVGAVHTGHILSHWPSLSVSSCRFLHQYQLAREQLSTLNKTPLCQYAAAASEMPYSDVWPSVEVLGDLNHKIGGSCFQDTCLTYLKRSILKTPKVFVPLLSSDLCLHWRQSISGREVLYTVSVISSVSPPPFPCLD